MKRMKINKRNQFFDWMAQYNKMVIDIDIHICNKQTRERGREREIMYIFPYKEDEG